MNAARENVRILRIFSRLNVGGPAVHVILLASELDPLGYATTIALGTEAPWEGNLRELADRKKVSCVQVPGLGREIRPWSDAQALWSLYRMMRALRPDIVHTHTAKAGVLGRSAAAPGRRSARSCTRTTATCCAATSAPRGRRSSAPSRRASPRATAS